MNIVLQQIETRRFYAGDGDWVREPGEALNFDDARHALQFCRRHHMQNVRLIAFLQGGKVSLLLYLPDSNAPAPDGVLHAVN
jgi:hypothetical protein